MSMRIKLEDLPDEYRKQAEKALNEDHSPAPTPNLEQHLSNASFSKKAYPRFNGPLSIRIHCKRKRLTDHDNICSKYAIDALVTGGILQDDNPECVKEISYTQEKSKENYTIIELWEY